MTALGGVGRDSASDKGESVTGAQIDTFLATVLALGDRDADSELQAVRAALLLEDAFGITLSDEEIDPVVLGDGAAIRRLLARHGVAG